MIDALKKKSNDAAYFAGLWNAFLSSQLKWKKAEIESLLSKLERDTKRLFDDSKL